MNVFQCIPAKYLVPVIKALGHQLEVLNVRLHMQVNLFFLYGVLPEATCSVANPESGYIPDHISENNFLGLEILKCFVAYPNPVPFLTLGSGIWDGKIRIRDKH
jgi:hypothetical protein